MSTRKDLIKELQQKAEKVRVLKTEHRQKRPIVIEFSGSPKAGKTSSINSLAIFLKRNGFSVKIVDERATACPVSDKLSPMFNLWTASTSLARMIGTLEDRRNDIDVLILDRGIFDSLCWFEWMVKAGRMEERQRVAAEGFLLMQEFVKSIDLVFAFTARPEVSIEREYATLLTDKLGTIMNKEVLAEYSAAVDETIKEKTKYFHEIIKIDTSDMTQDDVGKDVTLKALKSLQNLLIERIGYFDMNSELKDHLKSGITEYSDLVELLPEIQFGLRDEIEIGDLKLQPIPVAIVMNSKHDKVLVIKKSRGAVSNHSPEKDKLLLYVGGHTRFEDQTWDTKNSFLELCKSTLRREIKEEIGITVALENIVPFFIYDKSNDKSLRHLAVCFPIELDELTQLHLDAHELVLNKGRSKSGKFNDVCTLERDKMESWSRLLMDKFFASCSENETRQMTIEDYL